MKEEVVVKVDGANWQELQNKAFNKLNKKTKIDGFRPGKASRELFEKKYGKEEILYEAADEAIKIEYDKQIDTIKKDIMVQPKVELVKINDQELEIKFIFITRPEVTLGKYTNLNVKKEKVKVSKEEIKEKIDSLLEEYAELVEKDGKVENNDITVIDFRGLKDGVEFEGGKSENYQLTIGSKTFIPGFEEQLIGMQKGEEKSFEITFPEDYLAENLKGQKVVFEVKVNEIKTRVVPKLDNDFFEDLGMEGITNKEQLEKSIKEELETKKENDIEEKYQTECLNLAANNMKIDMSDELVESETEQMYDDFIHRLQHQGINEDLYLKYTNSTKEKLKESMKDEAIKGIKYNCLIHEVIKKEKIKLTDKEVNNRVKEIKEQYNISEEELYSKVPLEQIKNDMIYIKAIKLICKNEEKKKNEE